jgi:hypothetical protein
MVGNGVAKKTYTYKSFEAVAISFDIGTIIIEYGEFFNPMC